jgi:VWFA-related protein
LLTRIYDWTLQVTSIARCFRLLAVPLILDASMIMAQQSKVQEPPTLHVTTRLVLVNVVVTDRAGHTLTDLNKEDFTLLERGVKQHIATFGFEDLDKRRSGQAPRTLPPGYFTNRPEFHAPPGPLTLILLDLLNTLLVDQAYARNKMLEFFEGQTTPPGRTAVLVLGNELRLLQDFTTDSRLLRSALGEPRLQRRGQLPEEGEQPATPSVKFEGGSANEKEATELYEHMVQTLHELDKERIVATTDSRVAVTLKAFRVIARAMARFPGRKNLIWISAAFPLMLLPDPAIPVDLPRSYIEDMKKTAMLLTDAQVVVYPVDARGLIGSSVADASKQFSGPSLTELELFGNHSAMQELARDTGGLAFYNRNDLDRAIESSLAHGSKYYMLGYYPADTNWDGKFRAIEVEVARPGAHVDARHGYFAIDTSFGSGPGIEEYDELLLAVTKDPLASTAVTFFAHVLPHLSAARTEVVVEFSVDADTISLPKLDNDQRQCDLEFLVVAISPEGAVVAGQRETLKSSLSPETYATVVKGGLPLRSAVQLSPGRYQLRIGVRDRRSGNIGTTTIPLLLEKPHS